MARGFDDPAILLDLGRAFFIGEVFIADGAGPVFGVARLGAGGSLCLGFGQAVTRGFDDPAILLDLVLAVLVGEIFVADGAGPVFAVAVLGAGGLLLLGLGQAVSGGRDQPAILFDFGRSVFIGEVLAANRASPICAVAVLRTGGFFGLGLGQAVTRGFDDPAILSNFGRSVFIGEELAANRASPIRAVAALRAGGCFGLGLGQAVSGGGDQPAILCDLVFAVFIGEVLAANRASPIFAVAALRTGGCFGLGLGQAVTGGFDDPTVLRDLVFAVFIGEVLVANRASPIFAVAALRAGGSLRLGLGQTVAGGRNHPAILFDFVFPVFIGEELVANRASPIFAVAALGAGGCFGLGLGQAVSGGGDQPAILCDLVFAVFIGEVLAADGAGPIFAVAALGAGGFLRLGLGHAVRRRGLHHGSAERFRAEGLTRGFFGIDREIIQVDAGFHRIAVSIGFPDHKGTSDGTAAAQIDELHIAGAGDICRAGDHRVVGIRGDRNLLRAGNGQRAARDHAGAFVGERNVAGAGDLCRGGERRGAGIRGDRNILRAGNGQRTTHEHAGAFVGERNVAEAGNIRIAGDRRVVGVCGDRNILRTVDGQRVA